MEYDLYKEFATHLGESYGESTMKGLAFEQFIDMINTNKKITVNETLTVA